MQESDHFICEMFCLKLKCKQYIRVQIHTLQRKQYLSITKTKKSQKKVNTLFGQNAEFLNVKALKQEVSTVHYNSLIEQNPE
jgi:hypothetical protein